MGLFVSYIHQFHPERGRERERGASYRVVKRTHSTGSLGKIKFKLCEIIIILNEFFKFCSLGIKMAYWV
jgi:hypothetical protein